MDDYFFALPHVNIVVSYRKKTEEQLMEDILSEARKQILNPMHHVKTSSTYKYYHCKCCNNILEAQTRNAITAYPTLDKLDNAFAHKRAVYDYFRHSEDEEGVAGKIAGYIACLLSRYFKVGDRVPTGLVNQLEDRIIKIGLLEHPDFAMIRENEVILAVEEYDRYGGNSLYSSVSFIVQKQQDDHYKRISLNRSPMYQFWKDLTKT